MMTQTTVTTQRYMSLGWRMTGLRANAKTKTTGFKIECNEQGAVAIFV